MLPPFLNRAFNTALFYLGWILCLMAAIKEESFYSLAAVAGIILYQFYRSSDKKAASVFILSTMGIGPLSDGLYAHFGFLKYHTPYHSYEWLPPLWVFLLWALFAVNLPLFAWLRKKWGWIMLLGAMGGPMSYLSIIKSGSTSALKPFPLTLLVIGGAWTALFPFFMWLEQSLKKVFKG